MDMGMADKQLLIAFSQEKINLRIRIKNMQLFYQGCCQHHIPDKGSLYDEKFLQVYF
jgi:hypothetical protein